MSALIGYGVQSNDMRQALSEEYRETMIGPLGFAVDEVDSIGAGPQDLDHEHIRAHRRAF